MENIVRIFRGDPEKFEITRAMRYLFCFFFIMLIFVPIALYILFQEISDQVLNAVLSVLMVDIVCMFCIDVFVILVWCPYFYPDRSKQNRRHSDPSQKCRTAEQTSVQPPASLISNNVFRDISTYELSDHVNQLFDANGNEYSHERQGSLVNTKCAIDVSLMDKLNLDQNRTSTGHVSLPLSDTRQDRVKRQHARYWTEPQGTCMKASTGNVDAEEQSVSESVEEWIRQLDEKKPKTPQPAVRSFSRLKLKVNRSDSMASFRRPRETRKFIGSNRMDDALGLVPLSRSKPKHSSTEDWVFDQKNVPQDFDSKVLFAHKRSRSVPWNQRQNSYGTALSREEVSNSNKWTIPASEDDSRHRVLHRLLATILTTGDDDTLEPSLSGRRHESESEGIGLDVPVMELEQLPSGDYIMQMRMRLTSRELQNFTSRRATNLEYLVKGSFMENYLVTLCSRRDELCFRS